MYIMFALSNKIWYFSMTFLKLKIYIMIYINGRYSSIIYNLAYTYTIICITSY